MKKTLALIMVAYAFLFLVVGCASEIANERMRMAVEWRQKGDMEEYKYLVTDAYEADKNNPFALNDMGTIAESEGRYRTAERYYKRALENVGNEKVALSDVKADEGKFLKDVIAENLKNLQVKIKK